MRSFSILSVAAALAFSAFSFAAPLSVDGGLAVGAKVNVPRGLAEVDVKNVKILSSRDDVADVSIKNVKILSSRDLVDANVEDVKILSSRADLPSVPKILEDLIAELSPVVDKISTLVPGL